MKYNRKKAEEEFNELRRFVGDTYPQGKCKNLLKMFQILKKIEKDYVDIPQAVKRIPNSRASYYRKLINASLGVPTGDY